MKKICLLLYVLAAATLCSCSFSSVKSLQPFYTNNTLAVKPQIEGDWLLDFGVSASVLRIAKFTYHRDSSTLISAYKISALDVNTRYYYGDVQIGNPLKRINGTYYLYKKGTKKKERSSSTSSNEDDNTPILAHLFKLENGAYYFDVTKFCDIKADEYSIPIHSIMKLSVGKNSIILQLPSDKFFKESIRKNKVKIPLQMVEVVTSDAEADSTVLITAKPKQLQKFLLKYDSQLFEGKDNWIPIKRIVFSK